MVEDFRECDFGAFDGKSYAELNGVPDYQHWVDSDGMGDFQAERIRRISEDGRQTHFSRWQRNCLQTASGTLPLPSMEEPS